MGRRTLAEQLSSILWLFCDLRRLQRIKADRIRNITANVNEMIIEFFNTRGSLKTLFITDTKNADKLEIEVKRLMSAKTSLRSGNNIH